MTSNHRKAILITYPQKDAIKEAISLACTAGYNIEKIVSQLESEVIIFDEVMKPTQQYNLATLCQVEIVDRERLILEIFERRASTAESRIQIKLAQLRYDMVRAREKVRLAKMGEQPGFFGMGKYDADIYYLDIN